MTNDIENDIFRYQIFIIIYERMMQNFFIINTYYMLKYTKNKYIERDLNNF